VTQPSTREALLDASQVARFLGVSKSWVLDHSNGRRRPLLRSVKLGKCVRFRQSDVEDLLDACERHLGNGDGKLTTPQH
jgi:predicted DNA-binding transcriptional regulator AlpA